MQQQGLFPDQNQKQQQQNTEQGNAIGMIKKQVNNVEDKNQGIQQVMTFKRDLKRLLLIVGNSSSDSDDIKIGFFERNIKDAIAEILTDIDPEDSINLITQAIWVVWILCGNLNDLTQKSESAKEGVLFFPLLLAALDYIDVNNFKFDNEESLENCTLEGFYFILSYDSACASLIESNHFQKLQDFLGNSNARYQALKVIGTLTCISDDYTNIFIDQNIHWILTGYIEYPSKLKQNETKQISKEQQIYENGYKYQYFESYDQEFSCALAVCRRTLWVISNMICTKKRSKFQELVNSHILNNCMLLLAYNCLGQRAVKDCLYVIRNFCDNASIDQMENLITTFQIIQVLSPFLCDSSYSSEIHLLSLNIIKLVLDSSQDHQTACFLYKKIEEQGTLWSAIEQFQYNEVDMIYQQAQKIVEWQNNLVSIENNEF